MNELELRTSLGSTDPTRVELALREIGARELRALQEDVATLLKSPDPKLRRAAMRVLWHDWRLPQYRLPAFTMASEEQDQDAMNIAHIEWSAADHRGKKSPDVLAQHYRELVTPSLARAVRAAAYRALLEVYGAPLPNSEPSPEGPFEDWVDWALVREILAGTEVTLPVPDPTRPRGTEVRKIVFEHLHYGPTARLGCLILSFDGEGGLVDLVQLIHTGRRHWRATLPTETWQRLVAVMERCQFPREADISTPRVPDSASAALSWDRGGIVEALSITGGTAYAEVKRIAWAVMAQLAPDVVGEAVEAPGVRIENPLELR